MVIPSAEDEEAQADLLDTQMEADMSRYVPAQRGTLNHHRNMAALLLNEAEMRSTQNSEIRSAVISARRHRLTAQAKGFRLPA